MFNYSIVTYNPKNDFSQPHFYILCKGLNSGKPLLKPCPNCFVISCNTQQEKEFLYWVCYSLWQGKAFYHLHTGSVITFIRINEYKAFMKEKFTNAFHQKERHLEGMSKLQQLEALEKRYKQNLLFINDAKRSIMHFCIAKK